MPCATSSGAWANTSAATAPPPANDDALLRHAVRAAHPAGTVARIGAHHPQHAAVDSGVYAVLRRATVWHHDVGAHRRHARHRRALRLLRVGGLSRRLEWRGARAMGSRLRAVALAVAHL